MEKAPAKVRVNTLRELDALVGEHVTHEVPEVFWEDAHAVLRFESMEEALEAIQRMKSQMNLPKINWEEIKVTEIKSYRHYSSDIPAAWSVVEKLAGPGNDVRMRREKGMWYVAFGERAESPGRSALVAICAAGLLAAGIEAIYDPDRIN